MDTRRSPQNLMTVQDVARRLNLSESTVYSWLQSGNLPAIKLGAQWRVDPLKLDSWLSEQQSDQNDLGLTAVVDGMQGL